MLEELNKNLAFLVIRFELTKALRTLVKTVNSDTTGADLGGVLQREKLLGHQVGLLTVSSFIDEMYGELTTNANNNE